MEASLQGFNFTSEQIAQARGRMKSPAGVFATEASCRERYANVHKSDNLSDSLRAEVVDPKHEPSAGNGAVRGQGRPWSPELRKKMPPRPKNLFLSGLSEVSRELIVSRSTPVALRQKMKLGASGQQPTSAYFITSGLASIVMEMSDGASAEVGMIGRDGIVGSIDLLGPARSSAHCFVQIAGTALRIPVRELRSLFDSTEEIRNGMLKVLQRETMILNQVAGCNRLHAAEERLARWLLTAQDFVQTDNLEFTQTLLANMLGARRATVTLIAGSLQRAGLIKYHRGDVTILDRDGLKEAACDCYQVITELRGDLYNVS